MRWLFIVLPVLTITFSTCKKKKETVEFPILLLDEQFDETGDWVLTSNFVDTLPGDTAYATIEDGMLELFVNSATYWYSHGSCEAKLDLNGVIPENFNRGIIDIGVRNGSFSNNFHGKKNEFHFFFDDLLYWVDDYGSISLTKSDTLRIEFDYSREILTATRLSDNMDISDQVEVREITNPSRSVKMITTCYWGSEGRCSGQNMNQIEFIKIIGLR